MEYHQAVLPYVFTYMHLCASILSLGFTCTVKAYSAPRQINITPISDQDRISPYDINTMSIRKVIRIIKM